MTSVLRVATKLSLALMRANVYGATTGVMWPFIVLLLGVLQVVPVMLPVLVVLVTLPMLVRRYLRLCGRWPPHGNACW